MDHVELYLAHAYPAIPVADTLQPFDELRRNNRITAYGASTFAAAQLEGARDAEEALQEAALDTEAAGDDGQVQAIQNSHSPR